MKSYNSTYKIDLKHTALLLGILLMGLIGRAQIGGDNQPMKYSTHTYTVSMDNIGDNILWDLYDDTATEEGIIDGTDIPFSKSTKYSVIASGKTIATQKSYVTIRFDGDLPIDTDYQLVYREESGQNCFAFRFFPLHLNDVFDVDADIKYATDSDRCPDDSGELYQTAPTTQTDTISYLVSLQNVDYSVNGGTGTWSFQYSIDAMAIIGNNAIIEKVEIYINDILENTYTPETSSYSNSKNIQSNYKEAVFKVFYRHDLGSAQNLKFELTNIEGSFQEVDADILVPGSDNEYINTIYASPVVGTLEALN